MARKVIAMEGTKGLNEGELQDARKRSGLLNNRMMTRLVRQRDDKLLAIGSPFWMQRGGEEEEEEERRM